MSDLTSIVAVVVALFFAVNIGASGTAAAMGEPYGGGALRRSRTALILVAVCALAGAIVGGGAVTKTIGTELIDASAMTPTLVVVTLAAACITLFSANLLGIPLSTSEVTVGAVVGVGIALGGVNTGRLSAVLTTWILLPLTAFLITAFARRCIIPYLEMKLATVKNRAAARLGICTVLVAAGCYQAFGAGMNNVANAVGPLVSADLVDLSPALLLGGVGMGLGALILGGRVLETNAKRITRLSLLDATAASLTGGTLIVLASLIGIPVPLTQITAAAIMGIGFAKRGESGVNRALVTKIVRVWAISPIASLLFATGVASAILDNSTWSQTVVSGAWIVASMLLLVTQAKGLVRMPQGSPAKE